MTYKWYDTNTRMLELASYRLAELTALIKYRSDDMLELNRLRALGDIDCIIETLKSIQEDFESESK